MRAAHAHFQARLDAEIATGRWSPPSNPLTRLPGSGPKQDYDPTAGDDIVSRTLRDIRLQVATLPGAKDGYWSPPSTAQARADWIAAN
ncbi:hypothetical protein ACFY8N_29665 [Streptomyces collinus]|uniref:hypothetical protein n=1 Tax=Streptomyces collinus TaxID=42684 RepID=UPI00368A66B9